MATHSERQFRLFLISFVDADIVPWKIETVGTSVRKRLFFHWTSITRVADALGKRWDRTNKGHEETTSNEYTPERHFPTSYAMAIAEICKIMSEIHSRTEGTSLVALSMRFSTYFRTSFIFQNIPSACTIWTENERKCFTVRGRRSNRGKTCHNFLNIDSAQDCRPLMGFQLKYSTTYWQLRELILIELPLRIAGPREKCH